AVHLVKHAANPDGVSHVLDFTHRRAARLWSIASRGILALRRRRPPRPRHIPQKENGGCGPPFTSAASSGPFSFRRDFLRVAILLRRDRDAFERVGERAEQLTLLLVALHADVAGVDRPEHAQLLAVLVNREVLAALDRLQRGLLEG